MAYVSLKIALAAGATARERKLVARSVKAWRWRPVPLRGALAPLVQLVRDPHLADAIVIWRDRIAPSGTSSGGPILGQTVTDLSGRDKVQVVLSRVMFTEIPTCERLAIAHEIGHALGLRHADAPPRGIMQPRVGLVPGLVTNAEREKARQLRVANVVGVDSYEGN